MNNDSSIGELTLALKQLYDSLRDVSEFRGEIKAKTKSHEKLDAIYAAVDSKIAMTQQYTSELIKQIEKCNNETIVISKAYEKLISKRIDSYTEISQKFDTKVFKQIDILIGELKLANQSLLQITKMKDSLQTFELKFLPIMDNFKIIEKRYTRIVNILVGILLLIILFLSNLLFKIIPVNLNVFAQ